MRKLGRTKQISYPSHPDIIARADLAAAHLAVNVKFGGSKLRTGHMMNALALWAAELPPEELRSQLEPMLKRLEVFLGRDEASLDAEGSDVDAGLGKGALPLDEDGRAYNPVVETRVTPGPLAKRDRKRAKPTH